MMVDRILTSAEWKDVRRESYGGKAHGIALLIEMGFNVPYSVFLPSMTLKEFDSSLYGNSRKRKALMHMLAPMRRESRFDVAIRSSATCEDGTVHSQAGRFSSFLGLMSYEELLQKSKQVIEGLDMNDVKGLGRMGLVIQKRIDAAFSGVTFSSDPITGSRVLCVSSLTSGMGGPLVSGRNEGEDVIIQIKNGAFRVPRYHTPIQKNQLKRICGIAKKIERRLGRPVDIEWCLSSETEDPFILQCRPATGIFSLCSSILDLKTVEESEIFPQIRSNPKIALRQHANKVGSKMPDTYLVTMTRNREASHVPNLDKIKPSSYWNGYSIVLVYPARIKGKIVRCFLGDEYLRELVEGCQRYTFRAFPKYSQLREALEDLADSAFKEYWLATAMIQEIYKAKYTGVCKRIADGYAVEIAKGYFVPKGVVQVSRYLLDLKGDILSADEVCQDRCIRIVGGFIIEQKLNINDSFIHIEPSVLSEIVKTFRRVLYRDDVAIEFGLYEEESTRQLVPYLIDMAQDKLGDKLSRRMLTDGVISNGTISGEAVVLDPEESIRKSLNVHLYDELEKEAGNGKNHVILCQKPDVSFLRLVQKYPPQRLGFAFAEGSVLCHLAIVLREKGIPAAVVGKIPDFVKGKNVTLDCITPGLKAGERIRIDS